MPAAPFDSSAIPSALGYFYKVRYALLLLLRAEADAILAIEKLDDVSFEREGTAEELLQFKHHLDRAATLTDASSDLWKTLRVWCEALRNGVVVPNQTPLVLVTTAIAPNGSVAEALRNSAQRNVEEALRKLIDVAASSKSESNAPAYASFRSLSLEQQRDLLNSVVILDRAPDIDRVGEEIEGHLRPAACENHLKPFCERLEGWWFRRVIFHWRSNQNLPGISRRELQAEVDDLREQFHRDSLPADFRERVSVAEEKLPQSERRFIEQLKRVEVGQERIADAMSDFYRAFEQRSRWVREELVWQGELEQYDGRLIEEWRNLFYAMRDDAAGVSDPERAKRGRALYSSIVAQQLSIRMGFTYPYVMRGSYHMLANAPRVCWHPDLEADLLNLDPKSIEETK